MNAGVSKRPCASITGEPRSGAFVLVAVTAVMTPPVTTTVWSRRTAPATTSSTAAWVIVRSPGARDVIAVPRSLLHAVAPATTVQNATVRSGAVTTPPIIVINRLELSQQLLRLFGIVTDDRDLDEIIGDAGQVNGLEIDSATA